jgi:heme/copper-type cytochrome/quinol oxidase subunit 2
MKCEWFYSFVLKSLWIIIIIIIIIIIVITTTTTTNFVIRFVQGNHNYIPETNHVSGVCSVAAVL